LVYDDYHWNYTVSPKNAPNLASCTFNKHGLILTCFGKQHQRTFNDNWAIANRSRVSCARNTSSAPIINPWHSNLV